MDYLYLCKKFRAIRKRNKISQEYLAENSNISRESISKFENGGDMKLSNFVKMLQAMGKTIKIID